MKEVILTSYFSGKKHPQLGDPHLEGVEPDGRVGQNTITYIKRWYDSVNRLKIKSVVFCDNLTEEFRRKYSTKYVSFELVDSPVEYSYNDWRFFCFRNWLHENKDFDCVFHSDASDVTVVKNPSELLSKFPEYTFYACKDSIKLYEFPYISFHQHFGWENLFIFMINQRNWDLINMGVVGGRYQDMFRFYEEFCETRIRMGEPQINSDMWILQYLLREKIKHQGVLIGDPVTSEFKQYQNDRRDVYFIHK